MNNRNTFLARNFQNPKHLQNASTDLHISFSSDGMTIHFELAPMVTATLRSPESHLTQTHVHRGLEGLCADRKTYPEQGVSPQHLPSS